MSASKVRNKRGSYVVIRHGIPLVGSWVVSKSPNATPPSDKGPVIKGPREREEASCPECGGKASPIYGRGFFPRWKCLDACGWWRRVEKGTAEAFTHARIYRRTADSRTAISRAMASDRRWTR